MLSKVLRGVAGFLLCASAFAQSPVFGPTIGGGNSGGGSGNSVTQEFIYTAPGSHTFTHGLNNLFYQSTCSTRSGSGYAPATWTDNPVDANNATVTVPSAGDYICSFSAAGTITKDFSFVMVPTSLTYWPTMSGTQSPTFAVNQSALGGYTGTAAYTSSGLASGMTGAFSPSSLTGTSSSTLTLSFPYNQTPATTAFTVQGTDGTHTHTVSPSITIGNINSGLVECWAMTDGSGTTFADSCGTSNTQTKTAGTLTWASNTGLPGLTATFDATAYTTGANQTATNFNGSTPFSVSSWVQFNGTTGTRTIASTIDPAANTIGWEFLSDTPGAGPRNLEALLVNNYPSNAIGIVTSTTLSNGVLHYVVMTYDGSKSGTTGIKFYIDGVLATNAAPSLNTLTGTIANTKPVSLGARPGGVDPLIGIEAYTRIYNRVLSQADVTNYYAAGPR